MENSRNIYPIIIEISKGKKPFKVDIKDTNFDRPISALTTTYQEPEKKLFSPVDYGEFEFINPNINH